MSPLRALVRKSVKFLRTKNNKKRFHEIKYRFEKITEHFQFNRIFNERIKCEKSGSRPLLELEEKSKIGRQPIVIASRFLNSTEERYRVNEREWPKIFN